MCLPKGTAVLERTRREWVAMFVVVSISLTADLQKLLHIVSSLVGWRDSVYQPAPFLPDPPKWTTKLLKYELSPPNECQPH